MEINLQPMRLYLDSSSYDIFFSNGDLQFNLIQPIYIPKNYYATVCLSEFTMAITQTNINTSNNSLKFARGANNFIVQVPSGTYTIDSLLSYFNSEPQLASYSISATFNEITNLISFVSNAEFRIVVGDHSTMLSIIGFQNHTADIISNANNILTADIPLDLSGNNTIIVTSQLLTNNYTWIKGSGNQYNGRGSNALAKIQVTGANGDILFFNDIQRFENKINDNLITNMRITILDENGNIYNQCQLGWSCTIDLKFYKIQNNNNLQTISEK